MLSRYQARWADGRLEAVARGVMWLGTGGWEAALGGMREWSYPTHDYTKQTLVNNIRSAHYYLRYRLRRIVYLHRSAKDIYSVLCDAPCVCATQRIIDSRVIVSWNQGPAPTTAANSSPSFNLALFLRIESLNPTRPTILYSYRQAQSRFL